MTILVTGGAGYIGSHFVRMMRELGRDVVVYDTLERGFREAVHDAPLVVGDIADQIRVADTCRKYSVEGIVHFAAYKSVGESMSDPAMYWRNNVAGSAALLEVAARESIDRIVFSSSCSVYGNPPTMPVDESAPIAPESVYAETKALVERMLFWYGQVGAVRSVSLRYFNAAGASADAAIGEDWGVALNLVPLAMKATLGFRAPLDVYGDDYPTPDGTAIRDYIHVDDLADAHVKALEYLASGGATTALNVGTGVGSSVLDVLRATERVAGRAVPHRIVERRAGDPIATFADPTKVLATLGWKPRRTLTEIVETAWNWHSTHPNGFRLR